MKTHQKRISIEVKISRKLSCFLTKPACIAGVRVSSPNFKAAAIGIASTPYGSRDPEHKSRQAAIRLIEGAVKGVKKRK